MEISEPYLSRFMARRDTSGGPDACWLYMAGRDNNGYGVHSVSPTKKERAHRIAVFLDGRAIPKGMTVDHLCRIRACANPRHLEVVTMGVNVARGHWAPHATCKQGHPTGPGDRTARGTCKTCKRIDNREYWRNKSGYYTRPR